MSSNNSVLSVQNVDSETTEEIKKYYVGFRHFDRFVRIGPKRVLYPEYPNMKEELSSFYKLSIRRSDIFVASFPRSGTTWTQELVWLVANNLDYATAYSKNLFERYNFLEFGNADHMKEFKKRDPNCIRIDKAVKMVCDGWGHERFSLMPDPRFIKTHIPLSMLPPNVEDTAKMIYVARDPRDVAISFYYFKRLVPRYEFIGDFKTFWDLFVRDLVVRCPYFDHVKEAWNKRNHPNFLFLFYEELSENLPGTIQRVCNFFGKRYTDDQISELCEHLKFENFKRNPSTNLNFLGKLNYFNVGEGSDFIRKGKTGGWRDYFDDEMAKQAETWIEDNLRDTDLRFPQVLT